MKSTVSTMDKLFNRAVNHLRDSVDIVKTRGYGGNMTEAALLLASTKDERALDILLSALDDSDYQHAHDDIMRAIRVCFTDCGAELSKERIGLPKP